MRKSKYLKPDIKRMKEKNRIEQLKEFIAEDPADVFSHYALALEYFNTGLNDEAEKEFLEVLKIKKDYLPVYYQLGKLYESKNDFKKAIEIYKKGIEIAKDQKNLKTLNELRSAMEELEENGM